MKILKVMFTALILAACQDAPPPPTGQIETASLPDIQTIAMPDNPEAAKMTADFLDIMDKKMDLASQIGRIETRDQYVREVFIDMFSDPDLDSGVRKAFQTAGGVYVEAIDELNTAELKLILKDWTWRDLAQGENRLANRAFSIVQHTNDNAFRESVLADIKPLAEEGLMEGQQYALMYDRVNLKKEGGEQLYGTQTECVNGQYDVYRLAEPDTVDARRKAMDMQPLEPYLKQLRDHYGPCE